MVDRTSMYVIPVAKNTVTEIVVIEIASGVKVAVAQEIASEGDEGVNLAIKSDHAVLEVVLVPAATVQDHVIAKGQKGHDQKIVIEGEEIEEVDHAITSNHAVLEVVLVPAATV